MPDRGGGHQVTYEFLYIPECPVPLLWRDLSSKLGPQVTFPPKKDPLSSGLDHLFTLPLGNPSRWMEVAWSFGREVWWVKQSRERANPTIPWGLGERYPPSPPPHPPAPARARQTLSSGGKRTQTWCHTSQEMSVPATAGGLIWYLATYKYATAGGHHDWMPVSLEHTDLAS